MITLSNGHSFEYMVASGALAFDGKGWFWDRPFVKLGLIRPELFTVVIRTLTKEPRPYPVSNLSWVRPWTWLPWSPFSCVRFLPQGGAVNKVGLWNPGFDWWCEEVAPRIDFSKYSIAGSIQGTTEELVDMAERLNRFDFKAVEVNASCPNADHPMEEAEYAIQSAREVHRVSHHPLIEKVSVAQDYVVIARGLVGTAEAIDFNSVPYAIWVADSADPHSISPVAGVGKPGTGGGGVSGKLAQPYNWGAMEQIVREVPGMPVIGSSIMGYEDMEHARARGASAVSFGAIHMRTPWHPTSYVLRTQLNRRK